MYDLQSQAIHDFSGVQEPGGKFYQVDHTISPAAGTIHYQYVVTNLEVMDASVIVGTFHFDAAGWFCRKTLFKIDKQTLQAEVVASLVVTDPKDRARSAIRNEYYELSAKMPGIIPAHKLENYHISLQKFIPSVMQVDFGNPKVAILKY